MPDVSGMEKLAALDEIKRLKARRDEAADTKDWVAYEALHAPDHCSHHDDYPPWTTAKEMIANISKIMQGLTTYHQSHNPEITFTSSTTAHGVWAMKGMSFWSQSGEDHWFLGLGHYHETYARRDGRWVFTSRRLTYVHTMTSPGGIFPPPAPSSAGALG